MSKLKSLKDLKIPIGEGHYIEMIELSQESTFPTIQRITELYGSAIAEIIKEDRELEALPITRKDLLVYFVKTKGGKVSEKEILRQYSSSIHSNILYELSRLEEEGRLASETLDEKKFYYLPE